MPMTDEEKQVGIQNILKAVEKELTFAVMNGQPLQFTVSAFGKEAPPSKDAKGQLWAEHVPTGDRAVIILIGNPVIRMDRVVSNFFNGLIVADDKDVKNEFPKIPAKRP